MPNRRVTLVRRIRLNGCWQYLQPVISDHGRVSPELVKMNGQTVNVSGGVWYIAWYEGTKKKRKPIGPSLTAAVAEQQRHRQKLAALSVGVAIKEDDPTRRKIADAIPEFLQDVDLRDRQGETVQAYRLVLEPFGKHCPKTYLDQLDRTDILRYAKQLRGEGLSPRTVFNRFTSLQTFLKANGIQIVDKRDWPRFVSTEPEVYSAEELQRLFAACDPDQRLLFEFLLKTGCRMQEAMYVCWSDINLKQRTFRVSAKPAMDFKPKSWEEREIPLEEGLACVLEARKESRVGTTLIFPTRNGRPNNKMLRGLKRVARRAGLNCGECSTCIQGAGSQSQECERWFLHKFRATFATMHLQAGVDLRTVQAWLGHKDLASTMRYLKPARGREVRERFNRTFTELSAKPRPIPQPADHEYEQQSLKA